MQRTIAVICVVFFVAPLSHSEAKDAFAVAPTGLVVANHDPHSVTLGWNFTTPPNFDISDVSFALIVKNGDKEVANKTVQGSAERTCDFLGLENGTTYSVEIFASTRTDGRISDSLNGTFTTLAEDWSTPSLSVFPSQREPTLEYSVRWIISNNESLSEFVVSECVPECTSKNFPSETRGYRVTVPYYTNISFTVTAVFTQPIGKPLTRQSRTYNEMSGVGKPSAVRLIFTNEVIGDTLMLVWGPPEALKGPITGYNLRFVDVIGGSILKEETAKPELNATLTGYLYTVGIQAYSWDPPTSKNILSYWFILDRTMRKPEAPKDWKIIEYNSTNIRFEIIPSVTSDILRYYVMAFQDGFGDPRVRDESGSLTNEIYNFEPYTTIHVIFTAYVNSERLTDPFYGESLRKTITSNVEAPSAVRELQVTLSPDDTPILRWRAPQYPRGPIDGYKIVIKDDDEKLLNETTVSHDRKAKLQSFTYGEHNGLNPFNFTVVAFNYDLKTKDPLIGEESSVELSKSFGGWPVIGGVGGAIVLLAAIVGILLYKRGTFRRERPAYRSFYSRDGTTQH